MRVLLTTPSFPPANSGLGNVVALHAKIMADAGIDVSVATYGPVRSSQEQDGVHVDRFPISGSASILHPIRGDDRSYRSFLSSSDFDLVIFHAWQNWATDLGLPVLTDISGKKLVFSHCISTNTIFPTRPFRSTIRYLTWRPYWWKLPKWIRALDGVVFLAKDGVGDRFDDLKLAHELGVATYHVPNMGQSFASKLRRGAEERTSILSVGSYDWFKGFDFVIRAYAASSAKNSLPLKLFGQKFTSYTKKLRVLAANLGIDSAFMEFNERLSGPELLECYQTARIFVCGSHSECQPLAILDAMASGAPFVARSTGCIGSLRGGIAVRTEKEAGQAISMLINEVSIWEELQSEGMQSAVREFSYSALQGALLDLVEKVCGKGA